VTLAWRPLTLPALERVLLSWEGTPYMVGQQAKGAGVDCVRFVAGVLDELRGRATPVATLPNDAALHNRAGAVAAMRRILELQRPWVPVEDGTVEPGDVLVWAPRGGGPGHATIAGGERFVLWESSVSGVRRTAIGAMLVHGAWAFSGAFRPTDKTSWRASA
jgi:cell wall-associated NlpC family hydrolase